MHESSSGQIEIVIDGQHVYVACVGHYSPSQLREEWEAATANPSFPARPLVLVDLTDSASVLSRSSGSLRETATYFSTQLRARRAACALVAASLARYGLMRMAQAWATVESDDFEIAVFRRRDAALAWLSSRDGAIHPDTSASA